MDTRHLAQLSNDRLLQATAALVRERQTHTATLVAHLAEVQRRRAFREAGYGSIYQYCLHELHLSEHSAYRYIWAVRLARQFPGVLDAIADGLVHLAGLRELGPHMTPENASELLAAATHRTRAEIMLILATRFPRPDVPTVIRPLALGAASEPVPMAGPECAPAGLLAGPKTDTSDPELAPGRVASQALDEIPSPTGPLPTPVEPAPARVAPTSPGRFALQVALDQHTHDLLLRAQELLGQGSPDSKISRVLERALEDLVQKLEHRRFAATESPRARRSAGHGRYIPAEIRRLVAERDGYRCAFVSDTGKRCSERSDLEYDHIRPLARGGRTTVENLRLLCPAHNQYEAERMYGEGFMRTKREAAGHPLSCVRERAPSYASAYERALRRHATCVGPERYRPVGAPRCARQECPRRRTRPRLRHAPHSGCTKARTYCRRGLRLS